MVFCYQNCFDLLWEKIVLVIENVFCKFLAFSLEFKSFSQSLEQFFLIVDQNNFGNKIPFLKYNSKLEKNVNKYSTFASFLWEKFELNFDKNQISLSVFIRTWGVKPWISFLDSVQSNLKKDLEQRIITGHDMQSTFGLNKLLSKSMYTREVFKRNLKW